MSDDETKRNEPEAQEGSCDVKIWCSECQKSDYKTLGEKYLCVTCGKIIGLNHEVRHEIFPHVSGSDDVSSG